MAKGLDFSNLKFDGLKNNITARCVQVFLYAEQHAPGFFISNETVFYVVHELKAERALTPQERASIKAAIGRARVTLRTRYDKTLHVANSLARILVTPEEHLKLKGPTTMKRYNDAVVEVKYLSKKSDKAVANTPELRALKQSLGAANQALQLVNDPVFQAKLALPSAK